MKLVNIKSAGGREGRPYKASGNSTRRGGYDSSCEEHVGPMQRAHAVGAETEQERPQSGDNPYIAQYLGKRALSSHHWDESAQKHFVVPPNFKRTRGALLWSF